MGCRGPMMKDLDALRVWRRAGGGCHAPADQCHMPYITTVTRLLQRRDGRSESFLRRVRVLLAFNAYHFFPKLLGRGNVTGCYSEPSGPLDAVRRPAWLNSGTQSTMIDHEPV